MRLVESFDQEPALMVDGQAEGTARHSHAVAAQEGLRRAEQPGEDGVVVDPLKKPEEAAGVVEFATCRLYYGGDDPPNRFAVAERDEGLDDSSRA